MKPGKPERIVWAASTRGDLLTLGPAFKALHARRDAGFHHFLFHGGEQGMAAQQALDRLGLTPDEAAPLAHPGDEPAARLRLMLERVEAFVRQRHGSRIIFTGCGATAVAAAMTCHARGSRGLWLAPFDPAGVLDRLRLESGYRRIIEACRPAVEIVHLTGTNTNLETGEREHREGMRSGAPLVLIGVLRREWGIAQDVTTPLVRAAARWARMFPEIDWLFLRNLNARIEGPLGSMNDRPANLFGAPPMPQGPYASLLSRAAGLITDNSYMAAEAMQRGIKVATFGELPAGRESLDWNLSPADLNDGARMQRWLAEDSASHRGEHSGSAAVEAIEGWLSP